MSAPPRIISKPTMDSEGRWITAPHIIWRDAKGWHDRPAAKPEPFQPENHNGTTHRQSL